MRLSKLSNTRGSILVVAFTVLYVIVVLTAGFSMLTFGELSASQRYRDSAIALWLGETGLVRFLKDPKMLESGTQTLRFSTGTVVLSKDDSLPQKRVLTSTGVVHGLRHSVAVDFLARPPVAFDNMISSGGDLIVRGNKTVATISSRLRLGGKLVNKSRWSSLLVEDKKESQPMSRVTLIYPDADHNGTADEFSDFIEFNRNLIASYPKEDAVYIKSDRSFTIIPDAEILNKKIVYIEGTAGSGDVTVEFAGPWEKNQNLTVISTGTITFNQTIRMPESSQINFISWSGYRETSVLPSVHNGVIFTHGKAVFDHIYDSSTTNGNVIASGGVELGDIWSRKTFNYRDMVVHGVLPPGFEGLAGARGLGYESQPSGWREL